MFDKTLHPDCDTEGPGGVPMKDAVAKAVSAALKAHGKTDSEPVVKLAASAPEVSIGTDRTEVSKITTEAVDKDREVIIAKGVDLSAFTSNPVVLLNHNWGGLPLGKALWTKQDGDGISAKTQYAKRPSDWGDREWLPESVYELIKQDMLRGKSIGFLPLESRPPTKAEIGLRPELKDVRRIYTKTLMVEYSVVSIPSNSEAVIVSKSYPGLAAVLGVAKAPIEDDDEDDDDTPLEDMLKRFEVYAKELPNPDELTEAIAHVKAILMERDELAQWRKARDEDMDAVKRAIRMIRKDLLSPPKAKQPQPVDVERLHDALKRNFAKIA